MKGKSLGLRGLVTFCIMVALGSISNLSVAACSISKSNLAGHWSYSEQGTHNIYGPWSEVGSFTLNSSGSGSGVAVITAAQVGLTGLSTPLSAIQITSLNNETCIGTASFIAGGDTAHPRTITFTVISNSAFDYLSTAGDLTIIGHAIKLGTKNTQ